MSVSAGLLAEGGGRGVSQNTRTLNLTVDPDISWPGRCCGGGGWKARVNALPMTRSHLCCCWSWPRHPLSWNNGSHTTFPAFLSPQQILYWTLRTTHFRWSSGWKSWTRVLVLTWIMMLDISVYYSVSAINKRANITKRLVIINN